MSLPVALVDAFTRTPGLGNRAGVVVDPPPLDDSQRLAIARAVAASETAFVEAGDPLRLRYFTPTSEVPFCGHATVASLGYLAHVGRLRVPGTYAFECLAGRLEVELEPTDQGARVWLATPQYPWTDPPVDSASLLKLLGGRVEVLDPALPVQRSGPKLFVPLARRSDLFALQPRWDELAALGVNVFAFTRDVIEPGSVAHGRFFAPAQGIRDDPVTGAANGPLAAYLTLHGVIRLPATRGVVRARAEQGDAMGKPGRVDLEVTGAGEQIERVRIGGFSTVVFTGNVHVD